MEKSLIIVESPAKIKTLQKFLGPNFVFESSVGHIRDLPQKGFGIDVENNFEPEYEVLPDKKQVIQKIIAAAKECSTVYLSPDPDREGEAIAWHIASILPEGTNIKRATFNSITKEAVIKALDNPRDIDYSLVNAQQARRLLDRIVGYKISPILARHIQRGKRAPGEGSLSAGRVQSVALKLVVDREKEIDEFNPVEYWNVVATLNNKESQRDFSAYLYSVEGKRVEKEPVEGKEVYIVGDKDTADNILDRIKQSDFVVTKVDRKEKRRNPVPPFITSTIQQEASRHYGFSSAKTMTIAQGLYEGVDMGTEGMEGLITYMRTDSVRVAPEAITELREYIVAQFGQEFCPESPRSFSSKKTAQDAHEAIRPTNMEHPPEKVKEFLSIDHFRLYSLIWKRFVASQMNPAVYDTVSADVSSDEVVLRATGSILKFQGFLAVYEEKADDDEEEGKDKDLPELEEGQVPLLQDVTADQSFTRPPPRYSEASLVKELEKSGIGRPSTYATIMNKIQSREYTVKENRRLKPTELGQVIAQMLETSFKQIMDIGFTAKMEDDLEQVAEDHKDWRELISDFWKEFIPTVEIAEKEAFVPKILTDIDCPSCGTKLQKIWARNKYFYGCSGYPDCNYTTTEEELNFNKGDYDEKFNWDQLCPICTKEMKVRHGRFGCFLGCATYPDCKGIINIPKVGEEVIPVDQLPPCPALDCPGKIIPKKSRFGKTFYSCSTFPECNVIVNEIEELDVKYQAYPRTPYVKKVRGKKGAAEADAKGKGKKTKARKPRGPSTMSPSPLSPELQALVGVPEMQRTQVIKQVWVYIKDKGLQDPKDKRIIMPDEKLGAVLGTTEPINMFKLTGAISKHIMKVAK
ncbi:MAG: DNA topoisomerase-1 [Chlamydiales bacterium]|jgi:DNA topoisomerase-1